MPHEALKGFGGLGGALEVEDTRLSQIGKIK